MLIYHPKFRLQVMNPCRQCIFFSDCTVMTDQFVETYRVDNHFFIPVKNNKIKSPAVDRIIDIINDDFRSVCFLVNTAEQSDFMFRNRQSFFQIFIIDRYFFSYHFSAVDHSDITMPMFSLKRFLQPQFLYRFLFICTQAESRCIFNCD